MLAGLGLCGSALPLRAAPQSSQSSQPPAITVRGHKPVTIGGTTHAGQPCVSGAVAGDKAGTADCATDRLQRAARAAQRAAAADPRLAVPNATSGDTRVGVGSLTGSSQRLGADLRGRTTLPTRPTPPVATSPFPRRP